MSIFPDIDATCSSLGYHDGVKYHADSDFLQCLKHLIWILRRDGETHEYRRYIGHKQILKSDLLPMLLDCSENNEVADVLLRLLVNFTNPALLLYREELPKDNVGRRNFLELVEILQRYKESFAADGIWELLGKRLEKTLEIDWTERTEDQGLVIERILVLARNVLQVPSDPDSERRADNDANVHDQLIWSMHQAGFLDFVLYVLSSESEQQYHLHALEIIYLVYREQNAASLAEATAARSAAEKYKDEQELIAARQSERTKQEFKKLPGRHTRFGGTYTMVNTKSISDNPLICHQSIERVMDMNFDKDKKKQKRNFRLAPEQEKFERRSALSVRLLLREFCIEILRSAYNTLVRHVRRVLERSAGQSHDDSYLLWAIQFFMEFNRLNSSGFQVELVSESLSTNCFHWVVQRIQHHLDMIDSDKRHARIWGKRLHIALKTYKELIFNLQVLQKIPDEKSQALFSILQNNVFYILEYREIVLHLLMNYNEKNCTKAYLRDVLETAAFYFKMMEKFCNGRVVVQDRNKKRRKKKKGGAHKKTQQEKREEVERNLEELWEEISPSLAIVLANEISLPEEDHPIPFDATLEKSINDQKDDCMVRLHSMLRDGKYEQAVLLLRAAREVWPEHDHFGASTSAPEDELLLLRDIFFANLPRVEKPTDDPTNGMIDGVNDGNESNEDYDEEDDESNYTETDFKFDDFVRRLVNPKVVRACTSVLVDWRHIPTRSLKSTVAILHHIAVRCKMPVMLFQARLFRVFQTVLHAKVDKHNEELQRLAVFIVKQFVQVAPNNPKIFAELLFFKSIREAEMVSNGYEDVYNAHSGGNKKAKWTEQEEEELSRLFMENQANPETDEDVIDWIARNLIDQTKTRRQIILKLKQLGLIFKAPTKKSNASAANKRLWRPEQDEQLRELYDKFRLEENTLERIMDTFSLFKSKNAVVKRMLELGLIADRSEIIKRKRGKGGKKNEEGGSESDESSDEEGHHIWNREKQSFTKVKKTQKKAKESQKLDANMVKRSVSEIEETHKEAFEWLIETLTEALEDIGEVPDDDEDTGIPIVPIEETQIQAIENDEFKRLMAAIGLHSPDETEQYWRIPIAFTPDDVKKRISLLKGEDLPEEPTSNHPNNDSDTDDAENMFGTWRAKTSTNLVYHESDNEDRFDQLKETNAKKPKKTKKKDKTPSESEESDPESNNFALSTQEIHSRLQELNASDTTPVLSDPKRKRIAIVESDSDDDQTISSTHVSRYEETMKENSVEKPVSKKRERSEDPLDDYDEQGSKDGTEKGDESDDGIRKVHKKPKNKRMVISDDDDSD